MKINIMRSKIFKDQDHEIKIFYDPWMWDQKITNNFGQRSFIFDPFGLQTVSYFAPLKKYVLLSRIGI